MIQWDNWIWLLVVAVAITLLIVIRQVRFPWKFSGRVTFVCDGDSVWVQTWYGRCVKLRLLGIAAPDSKQEYGEESQVFLDRLIGVKRIDILAVDRDIYGRYVSGIWYQGEDICLRMVEEGMA